MRCLVILLLLLPFHCLSQHATIAATKMNALYIGVPNPVSFTVENMKCSQLKLVVENGTVKKTGECEYNVMVTKPGTIFLALVKGCDTVYKTKYRVKNIPTPTTAYRNEPRPIFLDSVRSQTEIPAITEYFDFDAEFSIVSYEASVIKYKKLSAAAKLYCSRCSEKIETESYEVVSFGTNVGAKFNDTLKEFFFKELNVGDKVFIENIQARRPDGRVIRLNTIFFTVE